MAPVVNPPRYTFTSRQVHGLHDRARKVEFSCDAPNYEYRGFIEVMSGKDGVMEVHMVRNSLKKYVANARWHTETAYATLSVADWQYLITAPQE